MSKRSGLQRGGFYFNKSKTKKINLENRIDEGDAVIFYGSLVHGVETIDPGKKLSWKNDNGRWFLGMFVNDSDHVKNRITSEDLTGSIKENLINIKMSILITGANGEIGFDLVSKLSKKNKVYALYRSKKNKSRRIKNKNIKWIKCDLKKKIKFNSENAIKYIIHCAVDQKYRGKNKNYYINNNKSIINNIINFANKRSINLIINLSTIDVYGKIKSNIVHENFKPLKQNSYAYFKYFAENELYKQRQILLT